MADFSTTSLSSVPMPANTFISTCAEDCPIGSPLYSAGAGECGLAEANSVVKATLIGFAIQAGVADDRCRVKQSGPLTLTAAQWAARVSTDSGALVPGATYYLSQVTAGKIRRVLPDSGVVTVVGVALSTLCLLIKAG